MPLHDGERLEIANSVRKSLAIEDILSPVQARSFVRCLQTSWQVSTIRWNKTESITQLDDARRLIHSAAIFQQIEGQSSLNASLCYRRAAELLEWLSRATDSLSSTVPIELFSAGAYQLGNLPALASGLMGQVDLLDDGTLLYARFLTADFDGVIDLVRTFWQKYPELTHRSSSKRLLAEENSENMSWYATVELVRCLGLIADSLRRGDNDRFLKACTKLDALDRLAVRTFSDDISILIYLLSATAKRYDEASIYRPIYRFAEINPNYTSELGAFARRQFSRRRGILWSSQRQGLDRLVKESSFALCTPTGSGKTLVAILALVKELLLREEEGIAPLGLYLVPSRALAGEVEAKLTGELGQGFIITGLYGGADWGLTDYWLTASRPTVLIATVEKADALMRYLGPMMLKRLRLLIIDEAHQVVPESGENAIIRYAEHNCRSIRLEGFVARLLAQSPSIARIALTAVAEGACKPIASWIERQENVEAVGIQYRSTRQIIGMLETKPGISGRMFLDVVNGQSLRVRARGEPVYIPLQIPAMPQLPAEMRNSINRFNQLSVLWTALHLIHDSRRVLISVPQQPERTMGWFKGALELDNWQGVSSFEVPQDKDKHLRYQETLATCLDYCGEDSYEVALLKRGIATNYGQMPQRLRRLMTDLVDRRICPITVATATLTEGVNLPFDIIFITALRRTSFDPGTSSQIISPISTSEFSNLAGRAGRPGTSKGMEGMTLVAIPQSPSTTAKSQKRTQLQQIRTMRRDYDNLRADLLESEIEGENVESPLALLLNIIKERANTILGIRDDQFLGWLEVVIPVQVSEEAGMALSSAHARLADSIDELDGVLLSATEEFSQTMNRAIDRADAEGLLETLWRSTFSHVAAVQEAWLEQAFIKRGCAMIDNIYPDAEERKRLYQYGFTPSVGRRFEGVAPAILEVMENAVEYGAASQEQRLAVFEALVELLVSDRGYGFRVRGTVTDRTLLKNWKSVLAWWMQGGDVEGPQPSELRAWQRFVADNIEFRLGVAIGAVVAKVWSDGANDPLKVPSLADWRETTSLSWFGFWARELLRWGTLDPFVAFAMAQGLGRTRIQAAERRSEFEGWLYEQDVKICDDDLIDPQLFLEWKDSLPKRVTTRSDDISFEVELTGTNGKRGRYSVVPLDDRMMVKWLDAAGYELARSPMQVGQMIHNKDSYDYELFIDNGVAVIKQTSIETS